MSQHIIYFFDSYWRITRRIPPNFQLSINGEHQHCCTVDFLDQKVEGYGWCKKDAKTKAATKLLMQLHERFQHLYAEYQKVVGEYLNNLNIELDNDLKNQNQKTSLEDRLKDLFKDDILEPVKKSMKKTKKKANKQKASTPMEAMINENSNNELSEENLIDSFKDDLLETAETSNCKSMKNPHMKEGSTHMEPMANENSYNDPSERDLIDSFKDDILEPVKNSKDKFKTKAHKKKGSKQVEPMINENSYNDPSEGAIQSPTEDKFNLDSTSASIYNTIQEFNTNIAHPSMDDEDEMLEENTMYSNCEGADILPEGRFELLLQSICRGSLEPFLRFLLKRSEHSAKWFFNQKSNIALTYPIERLREIQYAMTPDSYYSNLVKVCRDFTLPLPVNKETTVFVEHCRKYKVTCRVLDVEHTIISKNPDNAYKQAALLVYDKLKKEHRPALEELYDICVRISNGMPVMTVLQQEKPFKVACSVNQIKRIGIGDDLETATNNAANEMLYYLLSTIAPTDSRKTQPPLTNPRDILKFKLYRNFMPTCSNERIDFLRHLCFYKSDAVHKLELKKLLDMDIKSPETRVVSFLHILNIKLKERPMADQKGAKQVFIEFENCELDTAFVGRKDEIYDRILKFLIDMTF